MSTHGPIDPEYTATMRALAKAIDDILNGKERPKTIGFALLMFPFGEGPKGRINYIGNADRGDMLAALKELIERWEGRHPEEQS